VSFVGATNDGLPALFKSHRGERKGRIEVFFLSESALRGLAFAGRDVAETLRLRRMGLDGLTRDLLDRVAEEWAVYDYDEPFVFASYWDAEVPGGRIHASSTAWGQDVKRAPSHDYVWPGDSAAPQRAYRFYAEALKSLRERARRMLASDPGD